MARRGNGSAALKLRAFRKSLSLETLEDRQYLSGGVSTLVAPGWFANGASANMPSHAGPPVYSTRDLASTSSSSLSIGQANAYDWIVQFDTAALAGVATVAQTASLLAGGGIRFEVVCGLGLQGQVLVRSYGTASGAVAQWLRSDRHVASYEMDSVRQAQAVPNDTKFPQLWGQQNTGQSGGRAGADINATAAWNISTGSRNVVVAVIDSGVDYTHPDLAANIWTNSREIPGNGRDDDGNGFVDDVHGYNFVSDTGNPMDDNGHGTHVAGTIGAVGNNGQGVAGVNWSVSIMPLKFLDAQGSGYTSDAIRAINYMTMLRTQYGVNVVVANNSWGGGGYDPGLYSAIQAAGNAGILFVVAAGNSGTNNDAVPQYPAGYELPNVISVAATDRNDQLASFSCYGASSVDLAAPGVSIYSTYPGNSYASMSGTSMATPHVAGVAALAWAVAPRATVAQVRDAILRGVDQLPSLAGKVATGGRLDAYNTLRLLSQGTPQTPAITSLLATPSAIEAGASITLTAQGVAEPGGAIAGVYFYQDVNGNGQWDSGDRQVGSTATVVGGQASIRLSTAGMTPGNYRLLARAVDAAGQWSAAVGTSLTLTAADDYGNSPATAALVAVGSGTPAVIQTLDDTDFFKFQAVAGRNYVFQTNLGSLYDSTLTLYDRDGQRVLAYNDDISSRNYASRIAWRAPASGTYCLAVAPYPGSGIGTYTLQVTSQNNAPLVSPIGNQSVQQGGVLGVTVSASDPDGDSLSYRAQAVSVNPIAQQVYNLDQGLGLCPTTRYRDNARGWHERYIGGAAGAVYFVVPNGTLYRLTSLTKLSRNTVVAQLPTAYYANPSLLYNAARPVATPVSPNVVGVSMTGNRLTIRPAASFAGNFMVQVTASDGQATATQVLAVTVTNAAQARRAGRSSARAVTLRGEGVDRVLSAGLASPRASLGQADPRTCAAVASGWMGRWSR